MTFYILDEREVWHKAALAAAKSHGFDGRRIFRGEDVNSDGLGFIRPHADQKALLKNQRDYDLMSARLSMFQDLDQMRLYEDKSAQFAKWPQWMPPTWRFTDHAQALAFVRAADYPLVSKADVGASSVNVRILKNELEGVGHVGLAFGRGIPVNHCAGTAMGLQKGYVLLQHFIPHTVTWRVNAIGNARAIFKRYCYRNRPVAETGNVEPVMEMTPEVESLLEYSNRFFKHANTKWCAIDVLQDAGKWYLLETSLCWPWPSPGRCNLAPLFGTNRKWSEMFEAMFDQYEAGAW